MFMCVCPELFLVNTSNNAEPQNPETNLAEEDLVSVIQKCHPESSYKAGGLHLTWWATRYVGLSYPQNLFFKKNMLNLPKVVDNFNLVK